MDMLTTDLAATLGDLASATRVSEASDLAPRTPFPQGNASTGRCGADEPGRVGGSSGSTRAYAKRQSTAPHRPPRRRRKPQARPVT